MTHCNRMLPWMLGLAAVAAVLTLAGVPFAGLLPYAAFLACPLMMVFMMKGMAGGHGDGGHGGVDHTGHGCEHDSTRRVEPPADSKR